MRFLFLVRILIGLSLLAGTVSGQLRLDPPSQTILQEGTIQFRILGATPGASLFVSVSYPAMGVRDWLTASRVGADLLEVTTLPRALELKTGSYVGYVTVVMNGILTARATVLLNRFTDRVRYRFYTPGQEIPGNELSITNASSSVTVLIDYSDNGGVVPNKPFRLLAESADGGAWLNANPKSGETGLTVETVTLTVDAQNLASRAAAYTGVVLVYDPAKPDDQSSLLVSLTVTGTPPGTRLTQGTPIPYVLASAGLANGERGYWVDVPQGSGRLRVEASGTSPISIHARWEQDIALNGAVILADASTPEASQPVLELTAFSTPALRPGRYYIALNLPGGTSSGFIAVEVLAADEPGLSNPVIAQIASGAEWKTTMLLVNKGESASTFSLRFKDDSGVIWPVPLMRLGPNPTDLGTVSTLTDTIQAGGFYTYQTREMPQVAVRQGYAELLSGAGIQGQAIFQQAAGGGFEYEAASPMEVGARRFALPFDNVAADGISTVTSMALVNGAAVGATVTARIRDDLGQLQDTRTIQLSAGQHRADTLATLLGSAVQNRRGLVEFESSGADIAALGLRFRRPFTSFGVLPVGTAGTEGTLVMSQIAAGGDWKTTIILVNTSESQQSFTLRFRDQAGSGWPVAVRRLGPNPATLGAAATVSANIPAWGTIAYQTVEAPQAEVRSGYGEVTSSGGVRGLAIFQQRTSAGFDYEASVPMQAAVKRFILPFDNVGSSGRMTQTGMALANPGGAGENEVTALIRNESGQVTNALGTTLSPGEQFAEQLTELFGAAVAGRGTIEFEAQGANVCAVGLRFRGPFSSFAIVLK